MGSELRVDAPGAMLRPAPGRGAPGPDQAAESIGALADRLAQALAAAGAPDARRDAYEVIATLLDVPRSWPIAHRERPVDAALHARAELALRRLLAGAPLAYAVGRAAFRHLTLEVDERVLIPRPETELLVDHVLRAVGAGGAVVDVGTGSGAIALALATEGAFDRVIATDVSLDALAVARRNAALVAHALRAPVELRHGSLLAPLAGERVRAVVCNPPYIAHDEAAALPATVRDWEPPVALFSGGEGLASTAALIAEAGGVLEPGGFLALEVDTRRAAAVAALVAADGRYTHVVVRPDLTRRERFVTAWRS